MNSKINIIIPSIQLSNELINCLLKLNNQNYKKFFVTIVLDFKNKIKLPKVNFKVNELISGKKNMSFKRNLGVKRFNSDLIAFLDSDAYPHKNWLKIAEKLLSKKINSHVIYGGPSIPFPKQKYEEKLCHFAKRSYYVTGYLNFRKYKAKSRFCDWVESCNMLMARNLYLKHGGMNIHTYLGEDKELIARMKMRDDSIKVFYTPKLFVYHKERNIKKLLLQRMVFGSDLFNIIKFGNKINGFQPILPLIVAISFTTIFFINLNFNLKLITLFTYILSILLLIIFDITKYLKKIKDILLTILIIIFANLAYVLGNCFAILGIKNLINRKFYIKSRHNE